MTQTTIHGPVSEGGGRLAALDGWRGLAALMVALFHLRAASHLSNLSIVLGAYLFVDFFFVLSGFVMVRAYGSKLGTSVSLPVFVLRRWRRLWPLHIAMLAVMVGFECTRAVLRGVAGQEMNFFAAPRELSAMASHVGLLQSFGFHSSETWNFPSWSIGAEFYTYILFALLWGAIRDKVIRVVVFVVLVGATALGLVQLGLPHIAAEAHRYGFIRCVWGFFSGVLLAVFLTPGTEAPPPTLMRVSESSLVWSGLEMMAVVMVGCVLWWGGVHQATFYAPLVFAGVVAIFSFQKGKVSKLLASKPMVWLGDRSYSIYMVHVPLIFALDIGISVVQGVIGHPLRIWVGEGAAARSLWRFGPPILMDGVAVLFVVGVLLLSDYTYRWIELRYYKSRWI